MSINACSINEHTINTLCGRRRQAIIDSLLPPIVIVGGGQQQHVHPDTAIPLNIFRRTREEEVVDIETLEMSHIQVTVEMKGEIFSQTLERENSVPMVSVFGLLLKDRMEEQVNISDFTIRVL
jgi:hypothetical protein